MFFSALHFCRVSRFLLMLLFPALLILSGCDSGSENKSAEQVSTQDSFSSTIPNALQKHRTGRVLRATLRIDDQAPLELIVDLENDLVRGARIEGLSPGNHVLTIEYYLDDILIATAMTTAEVVAGENRGVASSQFDLNPDLDGDGFSGVDEVLAGSDPGNPEDQPQAQPEPKAPNGVIDTPANNATILVGGAVDFTGTGTDIDNNLPLSYAWDFGGGATNANIEDPGTVTFETIGVFEVKFTVTDSLGLSDSSPASVFVTVEAPLNQAPNGIIDTPSGDNIIITAGESINFTGSGSDPDNTFPLTYEWQFSDEGISPSSEEDPGEIIFNTPGTYSVSFTVSDGLGLSDITPETRTVFVIAKRQLDVGLLSADLGPYAVDVKNKLLSTGQLNSVNIVDISARTPSSSELFDFDAILVWSQGSGFNDISDTVLLGDVLANYVDGGGGVVLAVHSFGINNAISGRFLTDNYHVIQPGTASKSGSPQALGTVFNPIHPLMEGVVSFSGGTSSYRPGTAFIDENATRIADWDDGTPLVALRPDLPAPRVDLGFYPPSDGRISGLWDRTTDGARLMSNALNFVGQGREERFEASLSGLDMPTPITTSGHGLLDLSINADQTEITLTLDVADLGSATTAAHLHLGGFGETTSGIVFELATGSFTSPLSRTLKAADISVASPLSTFREIVDAVLRGETYVKVHSNNNLGGEIRGQVRLLKPTLSNIQTMIFDQSCASLCHKLTEPDGTKPGLDLSTKAQSFNLLVGVDGLGVDSVNEPAIKRVKPGDPTNSYLIQKLEGTHNIGGQMPLNFGLLSSGQIQMIRDWISAGANNN